MYFGNLSEKDTFSQALKMANVSPRRYAEVTGWDYKSIVHWCRNGVPVKLGQAVYETFVLWNAIITFPRKEPKEKSYTKRAAPNQVNTIRKYKY